MRSSTFIMIGLAFLFGTLAVFVSNNWLEGQLNARLSTSQPQEAAKPSRTIVVASSPLRFGMELSQKNLKEIPWGADAVPSGSYTKIEEVLSQGRRLVLSSMEAEEPVLSFKVTGPGERATLSALIEEGRRAVTVRVDDVFGVAGFILPGDRVDVILTQQSDSRQNTSDVIVQAVKVLAVDQIADERAEKPVVVRAVTLEVDSTQAQKLNLASTLGALSLALRPAGEGANNPSRRVNVTDLLTEGKGTDNNGIANITVIRASERQSYSVPVEN